MKVSLLFLFLIVFMIIFKILENTRRIDTFITNKPRILFLLRSYNRPEYLERSLQSFDNSDIDLCYKKIIYDDCSDNEKTLKILDKYSKKYEIIYNKKNYGQKSMVRFLELIENGHKDYDLIFYFDNDTLVKPNCFNILLKTYKIIIEKEKLAVNKILLTGFNYEINHPVEKKYKYYLKKQSIGGINMIFHRSLLYKIKNWWDVGEDWEVGRQLKNEGGELFCTIKSCVQHIGITGHNSNENRYDKANDF